MENSFSLLPKEIQENILCELQGIRQLVLAETYPVFELILEKYQHLSLYNIGLYYSAGSWSYLSPTFSSEQGLASVAERYAKHSVSGIDEQKISLRWSPCDSPHHAPEDLEAMMEKTQDGLDRLDAILKQLNPTYDQQLMALYSEDDYYEIIEFVHELLRMLVIDVLKEIRTSLNKIGVSRCIFTLSAGDLSDEDLLENVRLINGESHYEKVRQELAASHAQHDIEYSRMELRLEAERLNPPSTQLTLNDFQLEIDKFNPGFIEINGGVYLDIPCDYSRDGSSSSENSFNRIEFMALLVLSSHYDELDKLYGHFLGNNFQSNDLFPSVCRAFAMKLGYQLIKIFPAESFKIYMIVDRNSLYHMTFCKQRDDGFQFESYRFDNHLGVEEVYLVGENKISLC